MNYLYSYSCQNWRRSVIVADYERRSSTGFLAWSSVFYSVRKKIEAEDGMRIHKYIFFVFICVTSELHRYVN